MVIRALYLSIAAILLSLIYTPGAAANDVFISQSGAGAQTGLSCATAKPATYFNSAGNWSLTPTGIQIGPDTVVHACNTFTGGFNTTMLTFQGPGTAGHPVILFLEPGAVFTSPAWAQAGAIQCNGDSNIFIDGGGTVTPFYGAPTDAGVIKDTDNGTNFSHQINSFAISADAGCNNFTVQHLNVQNMYVRVQNSPPIPGEEGAGISTFGSNTLLTHITLDHVRTALGWAYCGGATNFEASFNKETFVEHGVTVGSSNVPCNGSGVRIHDNDIGGGAYLWDTGNGGNDYHHDPIHVFNSGAVIAGVQIYNNYIHGVWGADSAYFNGLGNGGTHITSFLFIEGIGDNGEIFNNVIDTSGGGGLNFSDNGTIEIKTSGTTGQNSGNIKVWNNTIVTDQPQGKCVEFDAPGASFVNNICKGFQYAVYTPGYSAPFTNRVIPSNNDYFGATQWGLFDSFAGWQAKVGDVGSILTDPQLNATTYVPSSSSPVRAIGANLTSLGITLLNSDRSGLPRPTGSTKWDLGAQNFTGGGGAASLTFLPTPMPFGNQNVGTPSPTQQATASSTGTITLVLAASNAVTLGGTNPGDFQISAPGTTCANGATVPISCVVNVLFQPTSAGAKAATLNITGNASGTINLSGTGTIPATPTLVVAPTSGSFGNVLTGSPSTPISFTLTASGAIVNLNSPFFTKSGANPADFSVAGTGGTPCTSPLNMNPGDQCTFNSILTTAVSGARAATINISSNANAVAIPLTGTGTTAVLTATPTSFDYSNVGVGVLSALHNTTITNVGTGPVTMGSSPTFFNFSGGNHPSDFSRVSPGGTDCTPGQILAPAQFCLISTALTPTGTGSRTGNLNILSSAPTVSVALSGNGVGTTPVMAIAPAAFNFGNITVGGTPVVQVFVLTNTGDANMPLGTPPANLTGPNSGDFSIIGGTCGNGTIVNAFGGSCTFSVNAHPAAPGAKSATLTSTGAFPASSGLSATGQAPALTIAISPHGWIFPDQTKGSASAAKVLTVTNNGGGTVTLTTGALGLTGTNAADFSNFAATSTCHDGLVMLVNATCHYDIKFTPTIVAPPTETATLSVTTTSGASDSIALSGNGLAIPTPPAPAGQLVSIPAYFINWYGPSSTLTFTGVNFIPGKTVITLDGSAIPTVCPSVNSCTGTIPSTMVFLPGFPGRAHTIGIR